MQELQKNKKNSSIVIIVFLILVIIGLITYILYDKGIILNDRNSVEVKKKVKRDSEEIENLEVTDEKIQSIILNLTIGTSEYCGLWDYFTDQKVTSSDIPQKTVMQVALASLYRNNIIKSSEGTTFTKETLDNEIKKYFGDEYSFIHKTIDTTCPYYEYDEESEVYTEGEHGCGGFCPDTNKVKITNALKIGNTVELRVRVLFSNVLTETSENSPVTYFKDYKRTQPLDIPKNNYGEFNFEDSTYAEGTLYKMIFIENNGNYVFVSSEKIES